MGNGGGVGEEHGISTTRIGCKKMEKGSRPQGGLSLAVTLQEYNNLNRLKK